MKIYAAYKEYDACSQCGKDCTSNRKKKEYKAFYEREISCLRACVKQGWQCEEIELEDTCPEAVYNATVKGILPKDIRFA